MEAQWVNWFRFENQMETRFFLTQKLQIFWGKCVKMCKFTGGKLFKQIEHDHAWRLSPQNRFLPQNLQTNTLSPPQKNSPRLPTGQYFLDLVTCPTKDLFLAHWWLAGILAYVGEGGKQGKRHQIIFVPGFCRKIEQGLRWSAALHQLLACPRWWSSIPWWIGGHL